MCLNAQGDSRFSGLEAAYRARIIVTTPVSRGIVDSGVLGCRREPNNAFD